MVKHSLEMTKRNKNGRKIKSMNITCLYGVSNHGPLGYESNVLRSRLHFSSGGIFRRGKIWLESSPMKKLLSFASAGICGQNLSRFVCINSFGLIKVKKMDGICRYHLIDMVYLVVNFWTSMFLSACSAFKEWKSSWCLGGCV